MAEAHDPTTSRPENSSSSKTDGNEAGGFECNICFDLARDPVITLCGHLYCWPCLYRWFWGHSRAHECPVCRALVVEEKVIPLYGRKKTPVDPRSKPIPGIESSSRPAGQRPETTPAAEDSNFADVVLGLMGGFVPLASATFGNFGMAAGFGGMFSPFVGVQFHGLLNPNGYGATTGYSNGYASSYRNSEGRVNRGSRRAAQSDDENLTKILLVIFILVLITFLTM